MERDFTPEEKKQIEALGGLDKLMERLKELFDEQNRAPRRRQQVDRHGRHVAVRAWRL